MSLNHLEAYNQDLHAYLLAVASYARELGTQNLTYRPCPVCRGTDLSGFAHNGFFNYDRCDQCGLVFMNPTFPPEQVNEGFKGEDALLMQYFQLMIKYKQPLRTTIEDPMQDGQLKDIFSFKKQGRLLDIGCSVGDFLHRAKHYYDVEGIEVNPYTADVAADHFRIHRDYLGNLALGKDYDIVTLNQILYGVPSPVDLLNEIRAVLKEDGILYVNTPNADAYAVQLYGGRCNHLYGYTTQHVFSHSALAKLAACCGFKLASFRTEWLDIYLTDLLVFLDEPDHFIHRRNAQVLDYADRIRREEELIRHMNLELGHRGNYLVAVLVRQ